MSQLIAMAFPIVPEKFELWKEFIQTINDRYKSEFNNSRTEAGVRERTFLQQTPHGNMVIVTLEGDNPAASFQKLLSRNDSFSNWFAEQASIIHGVDLRQPMPGPMPEMVADSGAL